MKKKILFAAMHALAALVASAATFSLNSLEGEGDAVFGIDTLSHYASAYVLETYPSPRAITNVVQVLPVTQWGSGTITVKLGDKVKATHDFASDGTWAWQPTEKGTWTIIHSSAVPGGVGTATFIVSSIAFIEGEGSKDEPKTAEDAESVEHLIAEAEENEETIYVEVGGGHFVNYVRRTDDLHKKLLSENGVIVILMGSVGGMDIIVCDGQIP